MGITTASDAALDVITPDHAAVHELVTEHACGFDRQVVVFVAQVVGRADVIHDVRGAQDQAEGFHAIFIGHGFPQIWVLESVGIQLRAEDFHNPDPRQARTVRVAHVLIHFDNQILDKVALMHVDVGELTQQSPCCQNCGVVLTHPFGRGIAGLQFGARQAQIDVLRMHLAHALRIGAGDKVQPLAQRELRQSVRNQITLFGHGQRRTANFRLQTLYIHFLTGQQHRRTHQVWRECCTDTGELEAIRGLEQPVDVPQYGFGQFAELIPADRMGGVGHRCPAAVVGFEHLPR